MVCHDLTVLGGSHSTGIYVHIRVYLDCCDLEASRFQEQAGRRCYASNEMNIDLWARKTLHRTNDAFADPTDHASRDEDELCHYRRRKKVTRPRSFFKQTFKRTNEKLSQLGRRAPVT